ncbi:MAG: hypothetical protein HKM04_02560 [Legionellales bacterium]|nr:hypothetical protein [Legionellales bacterium]
MKISSYIWAALMGFIGSYVPLLSILTTVVAAFTISFFFPPLTVTLIAFGIAISTASLIGVRNMRRVHRENKLVAKQEQQLEEELQRKKNLKLDHEKNKEASLDTIRLINEVLLTNEEYQEANHYLDFVFKKVQHMPHEERMVFLWSPECDEINTLLSSLQNDKLSEKIFVEKTKKLKTTLQAIMTPEEVNLLKQEASPIRPISIPDLSSLKPSLHSKSNQTPGKAPLRESIGIGIKTSILSFALILSVTTIAATIILGTAPALMIAAAPFTVALVSTGIVTLAAVLGTLAGRFYHKYIAPQKMHDDFVKAKVTETIKNNQRLEKKIHAEKNILGDQKTLLSSIKNHTQPIHNSLLHKTEMLHKAIDLEYQESKKIGVKQALKVANHSKIKTHQSRPHPDKVAKAVLDNSLELASAPAPEPSESVDTEHLTSLLKNLSASEKEFLLQQLKNKDENPSNEAVYMSPKPHMNSGSGEDNGAKE